MKKYILLLIALLLISGCKKNNKDPNVKEYANGDYIYHTTYNDCRFDHEQNDIYYPQLLNIFLIQDDKDNIDELVDKVNGNLVGKISGDVVLLQIKVDEFLKDDLEEKVKLLNEQSNVLYASIDRPYLFNDQLDPYDHETILGSQVANGSDYPLELLGFYQLQKDHPDLVLKNIGMIDHGFIEDHEDLENIEMINQNSEHNHGLQVSGIIGASHNEVGIMGISTGAKIVAVDYDEIMNTAEYVEMIKQLLEKDCSIINHSYGISDSYERADILIKDLFADQIEDSNTYPAHYASIYQKAIQHTSNNALALLASLVYHQKDFLFVQSAGNANIDTIQNGYFASIDENMLNNTMMKTKLDTLGISFASIKNHLMIAGGHTINLEKTDESYGTNIDILAVDQNIYALDKDGYSYANGTSLASGFVSGAMNYLHSLYPDLPLSSLKKLVLEHSEVISKNNENDSRESYPVLNLNKIVEEYEKVKDMNLAIYWSDFIDNNLFTNTIPTMNVSFHVEGRHCYMMNLDTQIGYDFYLDEFGHLNSQEADVSNQKLIPIQNKNTKKGIQEKLIQKLHTDAFSSFAVRDYDHDGMLEGIVVIPGLKGNSMYYIKNNSLQTVLYDQPIQVVDAPVMMIDGEYYYIVHYLDEITNKDLIFGLENNKMVEKKLGVEGSHIKQLGKHQFTVSISKNDATSLQDTPSYKPYYFYLKEGKWIEYGAISISIDEFKKCYQAEDYLQQIEKIGFITNVLYRQNGLITVNYAIQKDSLYYYENITFELLGNTITPILVDDTKTDLEKYSYHGIYDTGKVSESITYPSSFLLS